MATVIFSSELQQFTGEEHTSVSSLIYRDLVQEILLRYEQLPREVIDKMAVAIDGEIIANPYLETIGPNSEVHFLYRISGG